MDNIDKCLDKIINKLSTLDKLADAFRLTGNFIVSDNLKAYAYSIARDIEKVRELARNTHDNGL